MLALLSGIAAAQTPPPIVGGSEATGWPYRQVGALVATKGSAGAAFCSGSLVDNQRVVTAAHCVLQGIDAYEGAGYTIHFVVADDVSGTWDASSTIKKTVVHPDYSSTSTPTDDIAVLYLDTAITGFGTLPVSTNAPKSSQVGEDITYVGYGLTDSDLSGSSGVRRKVKIPLYHFDGDFLYTYAGGASQNVCSGDSGGAAMWKRDDGTWELVGVNSFVFDLDGTYPPDCDSGKPAAGAVRIETTLSFLREHIDIPDEESDSDADSDADTDTDSDTDSDSDTDTATETGLLDTASPDDTGSDSEPGGCLGCASSSSPAGAGFGVFLLLGLLWRRRR
ncbi:MAG: trypsin-like serine protease [Myxococcota bacterium]|nr:trypsin-like serine protease [Myxococcota bacterium]